VFLNPEFLHFGELEQPTSKGDFSQLRPPFQARLVPLEPPPSLFQPQNLSASISGRIRRKQPRNRRLWTALS
ncbi:unnamed protein product, partial [Prunus brigantina]